MSRGAGVARFDVARTRALMTPTERCEVVEAGAYVQTWKEVARWRVELVVDGKDAYAVSERYVDAADAEREADRVQRLVTRDNWPALAVLVWEHALATVAFDDDTAPPMIVRIAPATKGEIPPGLFPILARVLRQRGLGLVADEVGWRAVALTCREARP